MQHAPHTPDLERLVRDRLESLDAHSRRRIALPIPEGAHANPVTGAAWTGLTNLDVLSTTAETRRDLLRVALHSDSLSEQEFVETGATDAATGLPRLLVGRCGPALCYLSSMADPSKGARAWRNRVVRFLRGLELRRVIPPVARISAAGADARTVRACSRRAGLALHAGFRGFLDAPEMHRLESLQVQL